jgi:hypothetical protein
MSQLLLRDLLADVAEGAPPVDPRVVDSALGQARRRRAARWIALPAASLVVVVLAALALLGGLPQLRGDALQPAAGEAPPTVPTTIEDFSYLTAPVGRAPAGRAIAVLSYYKMDLVRTVVLGADRDTYRLLEPEQQDTAEYGSAVLSPDGSVAAVERSAGAIDLLNLGTGAVKHLQLPNREGRAEVLAFSPDGKTLAAGVRTAAGGTAVPYLVDVQTSTAAQLLTRGVSELAFSPDGQRVAVQSGGEITVVDRAGRALRVIDIAATGAQLGGRNAWSPDGRFLVTVHTPGGGPVPCTFRFIPVDPATPAADVPAPRKYTDTRMVGWRSPTEMVLEEYQAPNFLLTVRNVRTADRTVLATVGGGTVDAVAAGLLSELEKRPAGKPDFGPWPAWLWWTLGLGTLLLALTTLVLVWVGRWAIRVNRRPFPPVPPASPPSL